MKKELKKRKRQVTAIAFAIAFIAIAFVTIAIAFVTTIVTIIAIIHCYFHCSF